MNVLNKYISNSYLANNYIKFLNYLFIYNNNVIYNLEQKIDNVIFIYLYNVIIPINYGLIKKLINIDDLNNLIIEFLKKNQEKNFKINENIVTLCYYSENYFDYYINENNNNLYSYNKIENQLYLYTLNNNSLLFSKYILLKLKINNNLDYLNIFSTDVNIFTFKLYKYNLFNNIYLKSYNQVINFLYSNNVKIYKIEFELYDDKGTLVSNKNINNDINNDDTDYISKYIRHPKNKNNIIDISLYFGQVKSEIKNNIFK